MVQHTGWPQFSVPRPDQNRSYIQDGNVECWIGRDGQDRGPAHGDFWRASPDGKFFFIRGYHEDEAQDRGVAPHTVFDITLPCWRLGETLLHATNMAAEFGDPEAKVTIVPEWTGLAGRTLIHLERRRNIFHTYRAHQNSFRSNLTCKPIKSAMLCLS
jgi:hypothetical protein